MGEVRLGDEVRCRQGDDSNDGRRSGEVSETNDERLGVIGVSLDVVKAGITTSMACRH